MTDPSAPTLHVQPTSAMPPAVLRDIRVMLDAAFPGDFSDDDWVHALGGIHVWLVQAGEVVSHGSVVERTLVCDGATLRVGYVEAVATVPERQGRGHGAVVMRRLNALIAERYPLAALSTGVPGFYEPLGWERWRGRSFVAAPQGLVPTPDDDDTLMILRTPQSPPLALDSDIVCDWRPGTVW